MYWKVLKDNKIIDVLNNLIFVKYQKKHNIMIVCNRQEAQGIISSNGDYVWHVFGLRDLPVDGYDTVDLVEIDRYEYDKLKMLGLKTPNEIIDSYTLMLLEDGIL